MDKLTGGKRMSVCRQFWVSGRVQGVFFRGSTQREALRLGLSGYARNLPDGRVEVLACGAQGAIDELERWLRKGPPAARVDDLRSISVPAQAVEDFSTG